MEPTDRFKTPSNAKRKMSTRGRQFSETAMTLTDMEMVLYCHETLDFGELDCYDNEYACRDRLPSNDFNSIEESENMETVAQNFRAATRVPTRVHDQYRRIYVDNNNTTNMYTSLRNNLIDYAVRQMTERMVVEDDTRIISDWTTSRLESDHSDQSVPDMEYPPARYPPPWGLFHGSQTRPVGRGVEFDQVVPTSEE